MRIVVCLDKRLGMMFNRRRQSRDTVLIDNLVALAAGSNIYCNSYSAPLFDGKSVIVDNDFLSKAGDDDYCFVEDVIPDDTVIDEIIVYRWNRAYPGDMHFPYDPADKMDFHRVSSVSFRGSSHDKITREVYTR